MCDILLNYDATLNCYDILKSNLKDHDFKLKNVTNLLDIPFGGVTREQYFGDIYKQSPPILSMDDVTFLSKKLFPVTTITTGWAKIMS